MTKEKHGFLMSYRCWKLRLHNIYTIKHRLELKYILSQFRIYMDDTFVVLHSAETTKFLKHMKSFGRHRQFTQRALRMTYCLC